MKELSPSLSLSQMANIGSWINWAPGLCSFQYHWVNTSRWADMSPKKQKLPLAVSPSVFSFTVSSIWRVIKLWPTGQIQSAIWLQNSHLGAVMLIIHLCLVYDCFQTIMAPLSRCDSTWPLSFRFDLMRYEAGNRPC